MRQYMLVADGSGPYGYTEAIQLARLRGIGMPPTPTEPQMIEAGYSKVVEVEAPQGDVVIEIAPVRNEEDGLWYQTYSVRDYTPEERQDIFNNAKATRLNDLNQMLANTLQAGFKFKLMDGTEYNFSLESRPVLLLQEQSNAVTADADGTDDPTHRPFDRLVTPVSGENLVIKRAELLALARLISEYRRRLVYTVALIQDQIYLVEGTDVSELPVLPPELTPWYAEGEVPEDPFAPAPEEPVE